MTKCYDLRKKDLVKAIKEVSTDMDFFAANFSKVWKILKKCKMVSVFTQPDVNTWEVGRTRDKRRKPRREAEWFPAYRVFSQPPKCLHQAV